MRLACSNVHIPLDFKLGTEWFFLMQILLQDTQYMETCLCLKFGLQVLVDTASCSDNGSEPVSNCQSSYVTGKSSMTKFSYHHGHSHATRSGKQSLLLKTYKQPGKKPIQQLGGDCACRRPVGLLFALGLAATTRLSFLRRHGF